MQISKYKQIKKSLHQIAKVLLMLVLTLSTFIGNFSVAYAAKPKFESLGSVTDKRGQYGWAKVGDFRVDGQRAFCIEHNLPTPPSTAEFYDKTYGNDRFGKALYYGADGIEEWSGFKSKNNAIIVTSLALSVINSGWNSVGGQNQGNEELGVNAFLDYIDSQPKPDMNISFTPNNVTASLSHDKTYQATPWITMNGNNSTTITLQEGVTLVKKDYSEYTNMVTINGGEDFFLKAPFTVNDEWTTGKITGTKPLFQPIILRNKKINQQDIGYLNILRDPREFEGFGVNWLSMGSMEIIKEDENGNKVGGVTFALSYDEQFTEEIGRYTTGENGTVSIEDLNAQTVYIKEVAVPQGMVLDETVESVTVQAGSTITYKKINQLIKGQITIQKNAEQLESYTPLQEANKQAFNKTLNEATTNRHDVISHHLEKDITNGQFEYKEQGLANVTYEIKAKEDIVHPINKNNVIYKSGELIETVITNEKGQATTNKLPLGKYEVVEVNVPNGIVLDSTPKEVSLTSTNTNVDLVEENVAITSERQNVEINITKQDKDTKEPLKNVYFGLVNTTPIIEKEKGIDIESQTVLSIGKTDENGKLTFDIDLPMGYEYEVKELFALKGYAMDHEKHMFTPFAKNTVKDIVINQTIFNQKILTDIQVNKVDSETKEAIVSKDFEFTMYEDQECTKEIKTVAANQTDGTATFEDLPYGTYYIKETKAPLGYELSDEVKEIIINEQLEGVGDIHSFVYENTLLPFDGGVATGDSTQYLIPTLLTVISIGGFLFILKKKKQEEL